MRGGLTRLALRAARRTLRIFRGGGQGNVMSAVIILTSPRPPPLNIAGIMFRMVHASLHQCTKVVAQKTIELLMGPQCSLYCRSTQNTVSVFPHRRIQIPLHKILPSSQQNDRGSVQKKNNIFRYDRSLRFRYPRNLPLKRAVGMGTVSKSARSILCIALCSAGSSRGIPQDSAVASAIAPANGSLAGRLTDVA